VKRGGDFRFSPLEVGVLSNALLVVECIASMDWPRCACLLDSSAYSIVVVVMDAVSSIVFVVVVFVDFCCCSLCVGSSRIHTLFLAR